jgi:prepilin-type N-terminal cleavage/methylation domain-containing protein
MFMTKVEHSHSTQSGYTIVEMMFAMGLVALLSSMAIVQINVSKPGLKGDGAMRIVLGQLNQARENAITQRRYVRVIFTAPNLVQIVREDTITTTTILSTVLIGGGVQFALVNGLPDTPEKLGKSAALNFGSVTNVKFSPEGTFVNQDGAFATGTAFLAIPDQPLSARAITVFGSTGRIRGYKWDGLNWNRV